MVFLGNGGLDGGKEGRKWIFHVGRITEENEYREADNLTIYRTFQRD